MSTAPPTSVPDSGALRFVQGSSRDFAAIEEIYRAAFPRYVQAVGRDLLSDPRSGLEEYRRDENLWVACDQIGIAGFVLLGTHPDRLELDEICVSPARQKTGFGPFLLDSIEQLARDRGVLKLSLNTTKIMTGLVRFYQRQGYQIVREGLPEHGLDDFQRVFMEKSIVA
jgi:ribosomal protein S18 acetylase RimI-like enzyme